MKLTTIKIPVELVAMLRKLEKHKRQATHEIIELLLKERERGLQNVTEGHWTVERRNTEAG